MLCLSVSSPVQPPASLALAVRGREAGQHALPRTGTAKPSLWRSTTSVGRSRTADWAGAEVGTAGALLRPRGALQGVVAQGRYDSVGRLDLQAGRAPPLGIRRGSDDRLVHVPRPAGIDVVADKEPEPCLGGLVRGLAFAWRFHPQVRRGPGGWGACASAGLALSRRRCGHVLAGGVARAL